MATSFTQHLISCIILRDPNIYDMKTAEQIVAATAGNGHRAADILTMILETYFGTDSSG